MNQLEKTLLKSCKDCEQAIDLFHPLCSMWTKEIIDFCGRDKGWTYIFLTKQSQNLIKWSPFPDNCWPGISVTANGDACLAYYGLRAITAGKRFVSFEPLHGQIGRDELRNLATVTDWWIIGAQTPYSEKTAPRIEWVREIVDVAGKAGIPVFLKNNLAPLIVSNKSFTEVEPIYVHKDGGFYKLRQEFPK